MVVPSANGIETMIFVFRGQPFVRAAVIASSSLDTRSLDYAYAAVPFIVPPFDAAEIGASTATAYSPAITYNLNLTTSNVASAQAIDPVVSYRIPYIAEYSSISHVWLGKPFVRGINPRGIYTESLDYVYQGTPFVITASAVWDSFRVASCSAPNPSLSYNIAFGTLSIATASAVEIKLTNHVGYDPDQGSMPLVWRGTPFIRSAFEPAIPEETRSLDFTYLATPFVLTSSVVPIVQTIVLPSSSVCSSTVPDLFIEQTALINEGLSYASVPNQAISIVQTIVIDTPTTSASAGTLSLQRIDLEDFRSPRHRLGQSGEKRRLRENENTYAWAKLLKINEKSAEKKIEGFVHVNLQNEKRIFIIAESELLMRKLEPDIKINVTRIR